MSRLYSAFIRLLETRIFPVVVGYAAYPLTILGTLLLLVPLIVYSNNTTVVLLSNSYLNVCSAAVSSIVLATSLKHHHETRRHIADLHAKVDALTAQKDAQP